MLTCSFSNVPDIVRFASVFHTNVDRLSTTPSRSLIRHAIFSQTKPLRRVNCLISLWKYRRKVSFPRTQRFVARLMNQTDSRQLSYCQLALFSIKLHRR